MSELINLYPIVQLVLDCYARQKAKQSIEKTPNLTNLMGNELDLLLDLSI